MNDNFLMNNGDDFSFEFNEENFVNGVNLFDKKKEEIKNVFEEVTMLFKCLKDENTWDSDTSKVITDNLVELDNSFKNINDEFQSYSDYLVSVYESYKVEDNKTNKIIEENEKNLDR